LPGACRSAHATPCTWGQVGATLRAETSGGDGSVDFFFSANYRLLLVVPFFVNIRVRVSLSNADKDGKRV
jgi:hypothetical protein